MQRRHILRLALTLPLALPGEAAADRGDYSLWITFRDFRYKDLGLDFRYTIDSFKVSPNNLWFQFRNRRTRPIRFKYELRAVLDSGIQEYRGLLQMAPVSMNSSQYVPGNALYRIYVDIDPDEYDKEEKKKGRAVEVTRQPAVLGEPARSGAGLERTPAAGAAPAPPGLKSLPGSGG